jgi:hypothetical protein
MESLPNNPQAPIEGEIFNEELLMRAEAIAQSLPLLGVDSAPLNVGEATGAMIVSTNPAKVLGNTQFVIDGTTYYVGISVSEISE